ncbi:MULTISPECIES: glycosyltransferase [unclassified Novosphingobium]|uniref:glycosyltransferase n=1 Tax=Novosphingobium TaxID=165696 RepID=UPI00146DC525|nr:MULTISPECIES: glycosyltransferase [unclassified Novosphingobium]NMN03574.1 alpha-1,6-mannosyltransferase [Novosphingobium sp. SG919]NMN86436.1 alpha-1,6-mannosyltransferase [Novosphingobium sp. SG916]
MKLVDVCAFYAPKGGGVRTYVDRKLKAGAALGHDVTVIAPGQHDHVEERGPNARIRWLKSQLFPLDFNYRWFSDIPALYAALDEEAPDFVEASSPWRSASVIAEWPGHAPRALIMHADPLSAYAYRWFDGVATRPTIDKAFERYWRHLRRLDERYDMIVSASASLSERLTGGGLAHVVTNPMGVDPGVFSPTFRDLALRKGMLELCELPEDATLLLGVGRFAPEKRWPMLVDAVTAAGSRRPVGLVLAGQGRERKAIERRIGGNPHIRVLAPITKRHELARVMASTDALLHGCEAETFCMVAAEARASGLPLIAPDQGGASDQARASGGWIYESANAAAATEAVAQYCLARESGLDGPRADLPPPRTMDDHFRELFASYEAVLAGARQAA